MTNEEKLADAFGAATGVYVVKVDKSLSNGWTAKKAVYMGNNADFATVLFEKSGENPQGVMLNLKSGNFYGGSPVFKDVHESAVSYLGTAIDAKIFGDKLDRHTRDDIRKSAAHNVISARPARSMG